MTKHIFLRTRMQGTKIFEETCNFTDESQTLKLLNQRQFQKFKSN